jgi:hypothetical protein
MKKQTAPTATPAPTPAPSLEVLRPFLGPRWTADHADACERCGTGGVVILCDWCNVVHHPACVSALLADHVGGVEWACPQCLNDAQGRKEMLDGYSVDERGAVEKFFGLDITRVAARPDGPGVDAFDDSLTTGAATLDHLVQVGTKRASKLQLDGRHKPVALTSDLVVLDEAQPAECHLGAQDGHQRQ